MTINLYFQVFIVTGLGLELTLVLTVLLGRLRKSARTNFPLIKTNFQFYKYLSKPLTIDGRATVRVRTV